jgi:hypothetical protein
MNNSVDTTEADILSHAVGALDADWVQIGRLLGSMRLAARDLDRADQLLAKNREGSITEAERTELEKYLRVSNFLALIRARALRESSARA